MLIVRGSLPLRFSGFQIALNRQPLQAGRWRPDAGSDVPLYCLEYNRYFDRPYLYGPPAEGYPDNLERFTFLSRGSLEVCKALGFIPEQLYYENNGRQERLTGVAGSAKVIPGVLG